MPRDPTHGGPNDQERLQHARDAALDVLRYVNGRSRSDLDTDSMLCRAVVNALQVIGEASARVSESGRKRVPGIPWGKIVGTRNILVHVYWGIDNNQVWSAAVNDVPVYLAEIERALAAWDESP